MSFREQLLSAMKNKRNKKHRRKWFKLSKQFSLFKVKYTFSCFFPYICNEMVRNIHNICSKLMWQFCLMTII
jgi:hypothetical protein